MPPKKQKKPPKNAFYFFMKKRKAELEAGGTRFPQGMRDVSSAVCAEWKVLPAAERAHYDELAREAKEAEKTNLKKKFTTTGESYESVERKLTAETAEKAELTAFFKRVVHTETPEERIYVVMDAISSCVVGLDNLTESKEYYPLELAAAAFSLKDGYIWGYWTLINTMSVPCGHASSVKETSEETCLPEPGSEFFQRVAPGARDYNKIMNHFRQFVETWCSDYPDKTFMVFAMDKNIKCVKGSLDWLVKHADENKDLNESFLHNVKFCSLQSMVIELGVLAHQLNPKYESLLQQFRQASFTEEVLGKGWYDYREEITCLYHNQEEFCQKMHMCCKNYILRRIFLILDHFSEVYSCTLTDRHRVSTFFSTTLPDHLSHRLPRPKEQNVPVSTSTAVEEDGQKPANSAIRSSNHDAVVWTPLGFEHNVHEDKTKALNDVSTTKARDAPDDFSMCYERRKRTRTSSPVTEQNQAAQISLGPIQNEKRRDCQGSSHAKLRSESHTLTGDTGVSPGSPGFPVSQCLSSKGRGRGFRPHDSSGEIQLTDTQSRMNDENPTSPPSTFRSFGRGQRGPTFAIW